MVAALAAFLAAQRPFKWAECSAFRSAVQIFLRGLDFIQSLQGQTFESSGDLIVISLYSGAGFLVRGSNFLHLSQDWYRGQGQTEASLGTVITMGSRGFRD